MPTEPKAPFEPLALPVPHLSIVIPVYNEEKRLGPALEKLINYLGKQIYRVEIILVDDGSIDRGIEIASKTLKEKGQVFRVVSYGKNRGKGFALKQGMMASRGEYVLFTDADLSTPIEELDQMWDWFEKGFEIVQGSRKMPGAAVELHQPFLRENMGKVFTFLSNLIANVQVTDVTCGFKCYRGPVARHIYGLQRIFDWSFDTEIIHIARKQGYKLKEVPVHWRDEEGTKVHLVRDAIRSFEGLIKIRINSWRGFYSSNPQTAPSWVEGSGFKVNKKP